MIDSTGASSAHTSEVLVVAVITQGRRPDRLKRLVRSIAELDALPATSVRIVVIDNGVAPTIRREDLSRSAEIYIAHEPVPGIPAARNRSVSEALNLGATVIAFVDDDERVAQGWAASALSQMNRSNAGAVAGKVDYEFEAPTPAWLRFGGFYDSPRHRSGDDLPFARTTNLFVRASDIARLGPEPFDLGLQFSGGSDVRMTQQLAASGVRIVWSEEALTVESVPEDRCKPGWALRRAYRVGNTAGRAMADQGGAMAKGATILRGLARIPVGSILLVAGLVAGRSERVGNGVRVMVRGLGIALSGIHAYREYRIS